MKLGSGSFEGPFDFRSRTADGKGTNPEELIGAAHAGCYSMALSSYLTQAGFIPERIHTSARVHFEKEGDGWAIPKIELTTEATVPGMEPEAFQKYAQQAKSNCPVSKALAGVQIELSAKLISSRAAG